MIGVSSLSKTVLAICAVLVVAATGQMVNVSIQGQVMDKQMKGIPGALVKVVESNLSAVTNQTGHYELKGTLTGVMRRANLPGGALLETRRGRLQVQVPAGQPLEARLVGPDGRSSRRTLSAPSAAQWVDLEAWLGPQAGAWFLRLGSGGEARTFRLVRAGRGAPVSIRGQALRTATQVGLPAARITAVADTNPTYVILEVTAAGYHMKRDLSNAVATDGHVTLIPSTASFKERILHFIEGYQGFRVAFLKKESPTSRKHILHYADFAQMTGDTLPVVAFPDSRGPANPESTPFGANVPAFSPDGGLIAYEIGNENQTVNNVSQIWLQPLAGSRVPGPPFPATNPRWWVNGPDRYLVWGTSGREDAWKDTTARTLRQKVVGNALSGSPEVVAKGSFNGGMGGPPEKFYLASAFRHGVMFESSSSSIRHFHVYPGQPPSKDGSPADSLQSCNASIWPNQADGSRMLFLDFGVPAGETPYPNKVRPQHYAQHQMILIGDFDSDAPGRIVDYIDSPPEELAKDKTWDDPEWSNSQSFAVATTRDPKGDLSNPSEPRPTQPDIYLIHIPTKSFLKILSGDHFTMPTLWMGPP